MVTLEKIDQVVERTGASYEEAKEALAKTEGNIIEAIILIQNSMEDEESFKKSVRPSDLIDTLKDFIRKGNVSRIIVKDKDVTLLNIPVTFGAIGVILAPVIGVIGIGTVLVTDINVSIQDSKGDIIDLNKETSERLEKIKLKGQHTKDKIKRKTEDLKEDAEDFVEEIKEDLKDLDEEIKDHLEDVKEDAVEAKDEVKEDLSKD